MLFDWITVPIRVLKYAPYFYIGVFLKRNSIKISWTITILSVFVFLITLYINKNIANTILVSVTESIVLGLSGSLAVIGISMNWKSIWESRNFRLIGRETMSIYIQHVFLCAVLRRLLYKLGITNFWVHITIGNILSIYLPICAVLIYRQAKQVCLARD